VEYPAGRPPGFLPRLGRSLTGLVTIGLAFLVNAVGTTYATGSSRSWAVRVPILAVLLLINIVVYFATFWVLTPKVSPRRLLPGAILGAVGFTLLITLGTGLVNHQLKHASSTYGAFGSVIGIVTFLLLLAKISLYTAELNPVLTRRLYPRALPMGQGQTEADRRVLADLVHAERRADDQAVGVGFGFGFGFGKDAAANAGADASRRHDP
jgi:uncharacterized BrkB/YihY/UPF0761 family membrane protein